MSTYLFTLKPVYPFMSSIDGFIFGRLFNENVRLYIDGLSGKLYC